MKFWLFHKLSRHDERGAVAVFVAITLVVLIGFTAFAVDVGYLYGVKNELHNAADAGALAGAHELFDDDGNLTVAAAIAEAERITPLNSTGNEAVTHLPIETGHWSFTENGGKGFFTPMPGVTEQFSTWQTTSFSVLDTTHEFINAVRVRTQRPETPSFFARIFGIDKFFLTSEAVAYIGFAGTLHPLEADQPIAICEDTISVDNHYECNIGRMINSGQNPGNENGETGGWTDFKQSEEANDVDVCHGGANATSVKDIILPKNGQCDGTNPTTIYLGKDMAMIGGQTGVLADLMTCWLEATENGTKPWSITLPVITCPSNNVGTCEEVVGAVTVTVVWITGNGNDPQYNNVPTRMGDWDGSNIVDGEARWLDFVDEENFNLKNVDGSPAPYQQNAIYFLPSCEKVAPRGTSGGKNFGILAEIPVLVK